MYRHSFWPSYKATIGMSCRQVFDGKPICVIGEYAVRLVQFFFMVLIWKAMDRQGADLGGFEIDQLITYSLMGSVLYQQLNIVTPATSSLWEGTIIGRYMRPMPVLGSFAAETVGRWWIPVFMFYSLPLWLGACMLGLRPLPVSAVNGGLSVISLTLSISLGFAMDMLFAAFAIRMKNGCWAAIQIKERLAFLLSGSCIPLALLPWGLGNVFALLPFGSIASAPLSIYVGVGMAPGKLIGFQIFWNLVLWIAAILIFHKSEEEMISYGG